MNFTELNWVCISDKQIFTRFQCEIDKYIVSVGAVPLYEPNIKINDPRIKAYNLEVISSKTDLKIGYLDKIAAQFGLSCYYTYKISKCAAHFGHISAIQLNTFLSKLSHMHAQIPTITEKPCKHCGKNNDFGVRECWWCATLDPAK